MILMSFKVYLVTFLFIIMVFFANIIPIYSKEQLLFDKKGIPMINYGIIKEDDVGVHYNPITIAHYADKVYDHFNQYTDELSKNIYIQYMKWLANNTIVYEDYAFYQYNFDLPTYNLTKPWYSAMAQAEVIPLFLIAHQVTHDKSFLFLAKKALNVLFIDIDHKCDCGVTIKSPASGWWFEEFANGRMDSPMVLNGMMFVLMNIYKYYKITQDKAALFLFYEGVLSIKNHISIFNKNEPYSSYDKYGGISPKAYHQAHVCLLGYLYESTRDETLKYYYYKWKQAHNDSEGLLELIDNGCVK